MRDESERAVLDLLDDLSNKGRWGAGDELGTLNYVTAEHRIAASRLVRTGEMISLGRDLSDILSAKNPIPLVHRMLYSRYSEPLATVDQTEIAPHGWETTHLDAVGHMFFDGQMYNGRRAADEVTSSGMRFGSIHAMRGGIVARGVLLDIPRATGVAFMPGTHGIRVADLEAAERLAGTTVMSGDALIVRAGLVEREAAEGEVSLGLLSGLEPECLRWLHNRQVALYGGDCDDKVPSGYEGLRFPLHQIGLSAMGLCLLDNVAVEGLAKHCASTGTYEFMLMVSPLRIPGATGSAVNPLALF
jgi:kynurenine formamidase